MVGLITPGDLRVTDILIIIAIAVHKRRQLNYHGTKSRLIVELVVPRNKEIASTSNKLIPTFLIM